MEWSVSSANLRFSGVFHVPGCSGGDDSCLIGGVGTRCNGLTTGILAGVGGGNAFAGESFVYRSGTVRERWGSTSKMQPLGKVMWNFTLGVADSDSMMGVVFSGEAMDISSPFSI